MSQTYVLAIDSGTTSARAILFDRKSKVISVKQKEFTQFFPQPGWVEHDAMEIWNTQLQVIRDLFAETGIEGTQISAIGITNQRETTVVWNRHTGKPIHKAIVWQCRRTAEICRKWKGTEIEDVIAKRTGLRLDAYFSATKLMWLLEKVEGAREMARAGDLLFGTIDTWLLWNLTGGKVHATDVSNASRTMLFDIVDLNWSEKLVKEFDIPSCVLPKVFPSSHPFGQTAKGLLGDVEIPIMGIAGDQQAALFGQTCFEAGMAKNTYGTGCFLVMNTGSERRISQNGLLTTVAWSLGDHVTYALEGSVFSAGATIQWLRDGLQLIKTSSDSYERAIAVPDNGGVYLVPAFAGLGAPYWDMDARGLICGLTRGTNVNHLVRAALESIAYQTRDLFEAITKDTDLHLSRLQVDGGATANPFLMQFQADLLQVEVHRPVNLETTALGAAYLAGLASGFWKNQREITSFRAPDEVFSPKLDQERANRFYSGWNEAVQRTASKKIEP